MSRFPQRAPPCRRCRCVPAICRSCCCRSGWRRASSRSPTARIELRVRVFPDKIHLDSHEPDLTADEQTWGRHYWELNWHAGDDTGAAADAWRQIADRFGASRAAWIVRVLTPTNASERPQPETPAGSPLTPAPVFPAITVASSDETWRHAPQARLLPDRWVAVVHSAGQVALAVTGKDIRRPLAAGPDPLAPPPDAATEAAIARGEQLPIDAGMKWMTDFDEAESAGMALRIPIPGATLAAGLDSLVVFGVVRALSVAETADQLANLFDGHHYTDGLAFIRPGTPTNNSDDRRAGYSSEDPGHARSFDLEAAAAPALDNNNALHTGTALGLRFDRILPTFGRVERGLERDDLHMRSMNTALWQVGWGYFLSNMIGAEAGLTRPDLEWARQHFLDHVRSFGPLPALRCGAQPYGLLPVTSLDLWQPDPGGGSAPQDTSLKSLLIALRDNLWRPAAASVARIGNRQDQPDPDADLADVMRTDALSNSYRTRHIFGSHFLRHLQLFLGSSMPVGDPAQIALLHQLGLPWRPRLARMWNADWHRTVVAPLVQDGEVSPWRKLEPDFISALLAESRIDQLILARPDPQAPADREQPAADAAAPCAASRDRVRGRTPAGRRDRRGQSGGSAQGCRARRSRHRREADVSLEASARTGIDGHRRRYDPRVSGSPDQLHDAGARRARRIPLESDGSRRASTAKLSSN